MIGHIYFDPLIVLDGMEIFLVANYYGVAHLVLLKHELSSVCLKAFLYLADITLYRMGFRVELRGANN